MVPSPYNHLCYSIYIFCLTQNYNQALFTKYLLLSTTGICPGLAGRYGPKQGVFKTGYVITILQCKFQSCKQGWLINADKLHAKNVLGKAAITLYYR